ncbi:unnamed protein product [Discosporangium mesarthrocarpum]
MRTISMLGMEEGRTQDEVEVQRKPARTLAPATWGSPDNGGSHVFDQDRTAASSVEGSNVHHVSVGVRVVEKGDEAGGGTRPRRRGAQGRAGPHVLQETGAETRDKGHHARAGRDTGVGAGALPPRLDPCKDEVEMSLGSSSRGDSEGGGEPLASSHTRPRPCLLEGEADQLVVGGG